MGTVIEIFRYERKYFVPEFAVEGIRNFVLAYLPRDEHMMPDQPLGYRVYSLYLDTPNLNLYGQTCDGIKNRFKLRIRFYDHAPESPAFLEIKRRTTDTIHKLRAAVSKRAAETVLQGGWISTAELIAPGDGSLRAMTEFLECRDRLHGRGSAFVSYRREAYVSPTAEAVRVTFDRQITGHPFRSGGGLQFPTEAARVPVEGVLLELKYNGRAPRWMHDLITSFNLTRQAFPKYVNCVNALRMKPGLARLLARSMRC